MKGKLVGVIAMVGTVMAMGTAVAAAECARPSEVVAAQMRVLQSDLMVAALSCQQSDRYAAFVERFRPELVERGHDLRAYFKRVYGSDDGQRKLDTLVTELANQASQRQMQWDAQYCASARALFDKMQSFAPTELASFVSGRPQSSTHGISGCD